MILLLKILPIFSTTCLSLCDIPRPACDPNGVNVSVSLAGSGLPEGVQINLRALHPQGDSALDVPLTHKDRRHLEGIADSRKSAVRCCDRGSTNAEPPPVKRSRVLERLTLDLYHTHFWIWAILVVAGLAICHRQDKQPDTSNNGNQADQNPPTAFPNIMEPSHCNCQCW